MFTLGSVCVLRVNFILFGYRPQIYKYFSFRVHVALEISVMLPVIYRRTKLKSGLSLYLLGSYNERESCVPRYYGTVLNHTYFFPIHQAVLVSRDSML